MKYRLQLYIEEGETSLEELARRCWALLEAWRATDPRADGWCYEAPSGLARVASVDDCARALADNTYRWHIGDQPRVSYEPLLLLGNPDVPEVSVRYTCGVGRIDIEGIFAPSRLEAIVDDAMTRQDGARLLQTWMLEAIEVLRPSFGHAGSLDIPQPLMPLARDPIPPVGWLTYLPHAWGTVPASLPPPSVAYPAPGGTLLVAHPQLFLAYQRSHRQAVEALAAALDRAGLLRPITSQPAGER